VGTSTLGNGELSALGVGDSSPPIDGELVVGTAGEGSGKLLAKANAKTTITIAAKAKTTFFDNQSPTNINSQKNA
jgi:hypothetical protein